MSSIYTFDHMTATPSASRGVWIVHWFGPLLRWLLGISDACLRIVFGRDLFISYSRKDAGRYAPALVKAIRAKREPKKLSFYLDRYISPSSSSLPRSLERHLRRSSLMVVVCTPCAVESPFVKKEVLIFGNLGRKVIPINVDGYFTCWRRCHWPFWDTAAAFTESGSLWKVVGGEAPEPESRIAIDLGEPSDAVIDRILNAIDFTVQEDRLHRIVWGTIIAAGLAVGGAFFLSAVLVGNAVREREAAKADAAVQRQVALSRYLVKQSEALRSQDFEQTSQSALLALYASSLDREVANQSDFHAAIDYSIRSAFRLLPARTISLPNPIRGQTLCCISPKGTYIDVEVAPNSLLESGSVRVYRTTDGTQIGAFAWSGGVFFRDNEDLVITEQGGQDLTVFHPPTQSLKNFHFADRARGPFSLSQDNRMGINGNGLVVDMNTGRVVACLNLEDNIYFPVDVSRNLRYAALGSTNGVAVYDLSTSSNGECPNQPVRAVYIFHPSASILALDLSPDGELIALALSDGSTRISECTSGLEVGRLALEGLSGLALSVRFSPDGQYVVSAPRTHVAHIFSATNGDTNFERVRLPHDEAVTAAQFMDQSRAVTTDRSGTIRVFGLFRTEQGFRLPFRQGDAKIDDTAANPFQLSRLAFAEDGRAVALADQASIKVYDGTSGHLKREWLGIHAGTAPSFSKDGEFLTFLSDRYLVTRRSIKTGRATRLPLETESSATNRNSLLVIKTLARSDEASFVLHDWEQGRIRSWRPWDPRATPMAIDPSNQYLAALTFPNTITLLSLLSGRPAWPPIVLQDSVSWGFSPEGNYLALGSRVDGTTFYRLSDGKKAFTLPFAGRVTAFDGKGNLFAVVTPDDIVHVVDLLKLSGFSDNARAEIANIPAGGTVSAVAFEPGDTRLLVVAGEGRGSRAYLEITRHTLNAEQLQVEVCSQLTTELSADERSRFKISKDSAKACPALPARPN